MNLAKRPEPDVVLIVDDVPENLSVLNDALEESGYTVLIANHGEAALQRATRGLPDIILLDAMMPGMDGFEVARRLKAEPLTAQIPIIFMTGLTETEHLVAALEAGGVDYITKPAKTAEVLARMGVHLASAKRARQQVQAHSQQASQARNALDAFGYASVTVRLRDGRLLWQTALARSLLNTYFSVDPMHPVPTLPEPVLVWLQRHVNDREAAAALSDGGLPQPTGEPPRYSVELGAQRLTFRLHQQAGESPGGADWLLVMQESSDTAIIDAMGSCFKLTAREAEVLYWVVKGKINRDIADIVGSSPATVKKHLERVFAKLGVETRTAAAAMAMTRIRQLHPQFEG
jgi:DNA-binding response OmpR family regulator/DNA-binding CsgD family transcriptional regulator